jgi:sugar O-acyltransferase (sialic acid O-acetyltransferase NeuD family)
MQDLVIYGAGGFGREVRLLIDQINAVSNTWNIIGFIDDNSEKQIVDGLPVKRMINDLLLKVQNIHVVIAVADPSTRWHIYEKLKDQVIYPTLIHPSANLGDLARNKIGKGCIITSGCILTTGITIRDFSILNLSSTVGHDTSVGEYCTIMPGCNISGNVTIAEQSLIGTGVQILQNLHIGKQCTIGAGAVVTKSIPDHSIAMGVPARVRERC